MSTELRQHVGLSLAALHEVSKHFDEADTAAERRASLQALCVQSEAAQHQAQSALVPAKAELGRVKQDLKAKSAILEDQKARALAAINAQCETAQAELWQLEEKVRKARKAIIDTDRSMDSLIRRLRVG